MQRLPLVAVFAAFLVSGCSTYAVQVTAVPDGATISWQNGGRIDESPTTIHYSSNARFMSGRCLRAQGITATWTSGAQAHSRPILMLCQGKTTYHLQLNRPPDAPGLSVDLRVAEIKTRQKMIALQEAREEFAKGLGAWLGTR